MTPRDVYLRLKGRIEIALIDLREEYAYAKAHPLFAACLPLSRLEMAIHDLIPAPSPSIVLYDDGEGLVGPAIALLRSCGFANVDALEGGLAGWKAAGLELFFDVNSPSKAFGEMVEHHAGTPHVTADDLQRMIDAGENVAVLDARRYDEYQTMTIPGAISVPGAELVLRAPALAHDKATQVVVNCAGRTRSIIGAQSLINAGIANPVRALRNGTIGWTLDGHDLHLRQSRGYPEVSPEEAHTAKERAWRVAYRAGVRTIGGADLQELRRIRTTYRFDVRSFDEFLAGRPAGFLHAPGGQLVQETDMFAPVRGAAIVLYDDLGARAAMTASWLAQMGWDAFILDAPHGLPFEHGPRLALDAPQCPVEEISPESLEAALESGALLVDFATSKEFAMGHIPGAHFMMRRRCDEDLAAALRARPIVLTSTGGRLARFAAREIAGLTKRPPSVLAGGTASWTRSGRPLAMGFSPALSPAQDVYLRPYEGTENPREKMQAYLDWEYGLVAQMERDGSHGFFVISGA